MIPAPFSFVRARSVDEALDALREHGDDAKLLAGGHSLLPLMKLRLATPSVLVDVNDVPDQSEIRLDGDEVVVGGLARHCELVSSAVLREHVPLLSAAAESVGDPQVRHRGTLAGSLAHADPASDLPAAVLALGGTITVRGPDGVRAIASDDFFLGFLETALADDEMITEVRVPKCTDAGWAFEKFNRRGAGLGDRRRGRRRGRPARGRAGQHGLDARPGGVGRGRAPIGRERHRRRRAGRRGDRAVLGPQRVRGVSPPPRARARPARARRRRRTRASGRERSHVGSMKHTRCGFPAPAS